MQKLVSAETAVSFIKSGDYRNTLDVDVAMVSVTPMDSHGYFNLSLVNSATKAILDKAKIIIVEINENLPRVFGIKDECIQYSPSGFSGSIG